MFGDGGLMPRNGFTSSERNGVWGLLHVTGGLVIQSSTIPDDPICCSSLDFAQPGST